MTQNRATLAESDGDHSETVRLKHLARINPSKSEIDDVPPETTVSFVPLEGFGTSGTIEASEERPLEAVRDGYTYFRENDIAIAKITPSFENGKGAICNGLTNGIGFGTTEIHVLRPRENTDRGFLWYVLRAKPFMDEAETSMRGVAGQKRLKSEFIETYRIPKLPPDQQRAIADFLDRRTARIDALVAKQKRLLDLLDEKRQAFITRAVTEGLDSTVATKSTEVEWFEEIPTQWETTQLKFLLNGIEQGWSPQCESKPTGPNEWGVLKTGCMNGAEFDSEENKRLPDDLNPRPELEIQQGEVLMSRANTRELVGSCGRVDEPVSKLLLCDKLYRLDLRESIYDPDFFVYVVNSAPSREQIEIDASGASQSMVNISQKFVRGMYVPHPPYDEQQKIVDYLDAKVAQISELKESVGDSIDTLQEKRQALISAAVTGQIDGIEGRGELQDQSV